MSPTIENKVTAQEGAETFEEETPNKVIKVELEIQSDKDDTSTGTNSDVGELLIISIYIFSSIHFGQLLGTK